MEHVSNFARTTGARWVWPLLALVLLIQVTVICLACLNERVPVVLGVVLLGGVGLLGTVALVYLLTRMALGIEGARQDEEAAYMCLLEALDEMPAAIELYDEKDRLAVCNRQVEEMFPYCRREVALGLTYEELLRSAMQQGQLAEASAGQEEAWIQQRLADRCGTHEPLLERLPNGNWVHLYETRTSSGNLVAIRVDVTETVRQREALDAAQAQVRAADLRLREAIDAMPAGLDIYDEQDRLVLYNQQLARMCPYLSDASAIGQTFEALTRRALAQGMIKAALGQEDEWLAKSLQERGKSEAPLLNRLDNGSWVHRYEKRTPSGYAIGVRLDVTALVEKSFELERANEQLSRLSTTDGLTGVANRRLFDQSLQGEWQRSARKEQPISLLMIDIDYFKPYNDQYGHLSGDECLRHVARILDGCAKRSGELLARYGGEEFALLLPGADVAEAIAVARRCMDELLQARIAHADSPISPWLTFSIGVATATVMADQNLQPESLLERADAALYQAKAAGRNRFEVDTMLPEMA